MKKEEESDKRKGIFLGIGRYIIGLALLLSPVGIILMKGESLQLIVLVLSKDMMPGINSVQISRDKSEIVAAYGDNYIRKFVGG